MKELGYRALSDLPKEKREMNSKVLKARYILRQRGKNPTLRNYKLYLEERCLSMNEVEEILSAPPKGKYPTEDPESALDNLDPVEIQAAPNGPDKDNKNAEPTEILEAEDKKNAVKNPQKNAKIDTLFKSQAARNTRSSAQTKAK